MTPLLLFLALSARAETSCLSRVAEEISALRPAFSRLDGLTLVLETFDSREDFFRARPRSPWRAPLERTYAVQVNRKVCDDPPPPAAEKAILAHELAHLDAYAAMGRAGLLRLGWEYLIRPGGKKVEEFEKSADDAAVAAGQGLGLADYREWLYPRVSPKTAERKRRLYRGPEELRALDKKRANR